MELKEWAMRIGIIIIGSCVCFSVMKAYSVYKEVKEISEAQREMQEFLDTWRKGV